MSTVKPTPWAAKRTGTLNRFYTRPEVGALLVREVGTTAPNKVVDLGAGEGSLAAAVASEWPGARITTVDLDPSCVASLHARLVEAGAEEHEHWERDVLDLGLPDDLGCGAFDLVVCNPPFYRPGWKRTFADILRRADFVDACPSLGDVSAEIIFLAQSLRLVRSGGTIALIVPSGLATGWRAAAFRRTLLAQHHLQSVIQLPPYSFENTEAYCFILVVRKDAGSRTQAVKLLGLATDGSIAPPIYICAEAAENRLDYNYHAASQKSAEGSTTLRKLGAQVQRGSLSTIDRKGLPDFVFHTGDFPVESRSIILEADVPSITSKRLIIAEAGDILMARVDRELYKKITIITKGKAAITDCVYRIRLPEQHRLFAFEALTCDVGRARIKATMKGVGARLLGKGELLDMPLEPAIIADRSILGGR